MTRSATSDRVTTGRLRGRRWPTWSWAVGAILMVAALVFGLLGIPALVRFPLSTDVTVHYNGTFELYVNQTTLQTLTAPVKVPMTVERTVKVRSGSFTNAVVTEDDTLKPGSMSLHQDFQYLMNRRTMAFENGSQTIMFSQRAKTDIAGTVRINFPLGTSATGRYLAWSPETDTAVVVAHGRGPHAMTGVSGVKVVDFTSAVTGPASPYYRRWLIANGFPASLAPAQLESMLTSAGVNLSTLSTSLLPVLTPSQRTLVEHLLSTPVPLDYTYAYRGIVAVEPRTGAIIWVDTTNESVSAAPASSVVDELRPLLTEYANVPGVSSLSNALTTLSAPRLVERDTWVETRASSQHMANLAVQQIRTINLVDALPWVVGGLGLVLLVIGLAFRRRPRHPVPVSAKLPATVPPKAA